MNNTYQYQTKENIKPQKLNGISNEQINDHWKLYQGYVKQVNMLNEELIQLTKNGKFGTLLYQDRKRRYGFEYNGMILHEYYFENLTSEKTNLSNGLLKKALEKTWGSFDNWIQDFKNTGKTRGIGWAILFLDSQTKQLTNHFILEHQNGIVANFKPILVMDVWEHAYMVDHKANGRNEYIDAFFENINWEIIEKRFE